MVCLRARRGRVLLHVLVSAVSTVEEEVEGRAEEEEQIRKRLEHLGAPTIDDDEEHPKGGEGDVY